MHQIDHEPEVCGDKGCDVTVPASSIGVCLCWLRPHGLEHGNISLAGRKSTHKKIENGSQFRKLDEKYTVKIFIMINSK